MELVPANAYFDIEIRDVEHKNNIPLIDHQAGRFGRPIVLVLKGARVLVAPNSEDLGEI